METEILKVPLTLEDMEGDYRSNSDCPLARATRRELKWNKPAIGGCDANNRKNGSKIYDIGEVVLNGEKLGQWDKRHIEIIKNSMLEDKCDEAYIELYWNDDIYE